MNTYALLELGLGILQSVLARSKNGEVAGEIITGVEAAIEDLRQVHGSPVTKEQLEGLRVEQIF